MENKSFIVGGKKCELLDLDDISLDEEDRLSEELNKFTTIENIVDIKFGSNSELKDFLSCIIKSKEPIDFGKITRPQALEMIKSFFLILIRRGISTKNSIGKLNREFLKGTQN